MIRLKIALSVFIMALLASAAPQAYAKSKVKHYHLHFSLRALPMNHGFHRHTHWTGIDVFEDPHGSLGDGQFTHTVIFFDSASQYSKGTFVCDGSLRRRTKIYCHADGMDSGFTLDRDLGTYHISFKEFDIPADDGEGFFPVQRRDRQNVYLPAELVEFL